MCVARGKGLTRAFATRGRISGDGKRGGKWEKTCLEPFDAGREDEGHGAWAAGCGMCGQEMVGGRW